MSSKVEPLAWLDQAMHEAERQGVETNFPMDCVQSDGSVQTFTIAHGEFDGIGALVSILRKMGWQVPSLPQAKFKYQPTRLKMMKAFALLVTRMLIPRRPIQWRHSVEMRGETVQPSIRISRIVSEADFHVWQLNAKRQNTSLNSLMLQKLDQAVYELLIQPGSKRHVWMIPVNFRGIFLRSRDTANHAIPMPIALHAKMTASDVHKTVKTRFTENMHWAMYHLLRMKFERQKGMSEITQRDSNASRAIVGVFTNLGSWPLPEMKPPASHETKDLPAAFSFCPPPSKTCPVIASSLNWNGTQTLSLRIHSGVGGDKRRTEEVMSLWIKKLNG